MIICLAFFIGIISGAFSSFVGGGAGLVTVPFLIFIGVPTYSAVATPKLGALGIAIGSLTKFSGTNYIKWKFMVWFFLIAIPSGIIGANLLIQTPEYVLRYIVATLLIVTAVTLYSNKTLGVISQVTSTLKKGIGFLFYFIAEGLRAAFGSGFGTLTSLVLMYFFGMTMLESSATKRVAGIVVSSIAFIVFLYKGFIDFQIGIPLFFGMIIGGFLGTRWAIKIGEVWLKHIFTLFAIVMSILIFSGVNISL